MATKTKPAAALAKPATSGFALASQVPGFVKPMENSGGNAVYVQFAHPQAPNWQDIQAAHGGKGMQQGRPVLINSHLGQPIVHLAPTFEFVLLKHYIQYWADSDAQGKMVKAFSSRDGDATEFIDAAILVVWKGDFIPATLRCRGPKCPGLKKAADMHTEVESDEWAARSKEHKAATQYKHPKTKEPLPSWAWFINTATITSTQAKRAGGRAYETMNTQDRPITAPEAVTLLQLSDDADFVARLTAALDGITRRKAEVDSKM